MTSTEPEVFNSRFDDEGLRGAIEGMFSLYADPYIAALREYVANALDAHREAGIVAPVVVTLTLIRRDRPGDSGEQLVELIVDDRGAGMPRERLSGVFAHYVGSGKRTDAQQIGGFGIGAKAALATGDFVVRSRHKGQTTELSVHYDGDDINNFVQDAATERAHDGTTIDARLCGITDEGWQRLTAYARLLAATSGAHITIAEPRGTRTFARPVGDALYDAASSVSGVHVYPFGSLLGGYGPEGTYVALHGIPYRIDLVGEDTQRAALDLYAGGLIPDLAWDGERHSMPRSRDTIRGVDASDLPSQEVARQVQERTEEAMVAQVCGPGGPVEAYRRAWEFADGGAGPYGTRWVEHLYAHSREGEGALLSTLLGTFSTPVTVLRVGREGTATVLSAQDTAYGLLSGRITAAELGLAVLPEGVKPPRSGTAALSAMIARSVAPEGDDDPTEFAVTSHPDLTVGLAETMAVITRLADSYGASTSAAADRRVRIFTEQDVAAARRRGRPLRTYDGEVLNDGQWEPVALTAAQWREVAADPSAVITDYRREVLYAAAADVQVPTAFGVPVTHTYRGTVNLGEHFTTYHLPTSVPGMKRSEVEHGFKERTAHLVAAEAGRLSARRDYDVATAAESIIAADGIAHALRRLNHRGEWLSDDVLRLAEIGHRYTGRSHSLRTYRVPPASAAEVAATAAVKSAADAAQAVFEQARSLADGHADAYAALARAAAALIEETVASALAARPVPYDYDALVAAMQQRG